MKYIKIMTILFIISFSSYSEKKITIENLNEEFENRIIKRFKNVDFNYKEFETDGAKIADEVYGTHSSIVKKEGQALLNSLPKFDNVLLKEYKLKLKNDDFKNAINNNKNFTSLLLLQKWWKPKRVAKAALNILTARDGVKKIANRSLLNAVIDDKIYILNKNKIVVKSLDDYFIIEIKHHTSGVFIPETILWYTK